MQHTESRMGIAHQEGRVTPQDPCEVAAARTAKALDMLERGRRAIENADLSAAEIELRAALAELPKIAIHLKESSSS